MPSSAAVPGHLRLGLCQVPAQLDALHRAHELRTQVAGARGRGERSQLTLSCSPGVLRATSGRPQRSEGNGKVSIGEYGKPPSPLSAAWRTASCTQRCCLVTPRLWSPSAALRLYLCCCCICCCCFRSAHACLLHALHSGRTPTTTKNKQLCGTHSLSLMLGIGDC